MKLSTSSGLVTPSNSQSVLAQRLACKAVEIEDPADIYFFRPLGLVVARCGAALGLTPTQLTWFSMLLGIAGGALFYDQRLGLVAFSLLITHGIFDSADGQLARMTGQVTEFGRVLDGVSGYVTHAAIYISVVIGLLQRGAPILILAWAAAAVIANVIQAQMYDYHRHHYSSIVSNGLVPNDDPAKVPSSFIGGLYHGYIATQHALNSLHVEVESNIAQRSTDGAVRDSDRARYRDCFRRPVLGWNLLGDNVRFCAIGVLACLHRTDLFFVFVLVPMNLILVALWFWQRKADRKFLTAI